MVKIFNSIFHTKSGSDLYFLYQKVLKLVNKIHVSLQNLLNLYLRILNSKRLFFSSETGIKAFWYKDIIFRRIQRENSEKEEN